MIHNIKKKYNFSYILLSLLILFQAATILAEEPAPDRKPSPYAGLKDLPKRYFNDAIYIITAPSRIRKEHLLPLALIAGVTGGLMAADETIRDWVRDDLYDDDFEDGLKEIKFLGNGLWEGAICGGFYIGGLMFRNEKWKDIGISGGEALLFAGGISQGIKNLTGRYRPDTDKGAFKWRGPTTESSISFPSGHATMAFALASVIATEYDDNILVGVASYGTASLVAFERVYGDAHWMSDVFFGAVIGIAVGRTIVLKNRKKEEEFSLVPVIDPDRDCFGIALNKRF